MRKFFVVLVALVAFGCEEYHDTDTDTDTDTDVCALVCEDPDQPTYFECVYPKEGTPCGGSGVCDGGGNCIEPD
jgi:hypothetical protein